MKVLNWSVENLRHCEWKSIKKKKICQARIQALIFVRVLVRIEVWDRKIDFGITYIRIIQFIGNKIKHKFSLFIRPSICQWQLLQIIIAAKEIKWKKIHEMNSNVHEKEFIIRNWLETKLDFYTKNWQHLLWSMFPFRWFASWISLCSWWSAFHWI